MKKIFILYVYAFVLAFSSVYAQPTLVKDFNKDISGGNGSEPSHMMTVGNIIYFQADTPHEGIELWRTNGTEAGTFMVKDIFEGGKSSNPKPLATINNIMFFTVHYSRGNDHIYTYELWKTDGTEEGTVMVKDLNPNNMEAVGYVSNIVVLNNMLFFLSRNGYYGQILWRSDGTEAGTVILKELIEADNLVLWNGALYFTTYDITNMSNVLWKSDGTQAGTTIIKTLAIWYLIATNNTLFLVVGTEAHGAELWKTDGTEAGTVMIKDINPGAASSSPIGINVNGTLFFTAESAGIGRELWKSDGTSAGTVLVKDIRVGSNSSGIEHWVNANGTLIFAANDGVTGVELWKSDGTAGGTVLVKNILNYVGSLGTNSGDSYPSYFFHVNGTTFFTAYGKNEGAELWKTNGTESGTVLVKNIKADFPPNIFSSVPQAEAHINGIVYLSAYNGENGRELWKTNGTEAGTVMVRDIAKSFHGGEPKNITKINDQIYFSVITSNALPNGASSTWKTNGTETEKIYDISSGGWSVDYPYNIYGFAQFNGFSFFAGENSTHGHELWKTDGTQAGTSMVKDINVGTNSSMAGAGFDYDFNALPNGKFVVANNLLFFPANDGINGLELWRTDGTATGTQLVKDISPGVESSNFSDFKVVNGILFLIVAQGNQTQRLYRTDGTEAGTYELMPNSSVGGWYLMGDTNQTLFFYASTSTVSGGLWKTDGTTAGTILVKQSGTQIGDFRSISEMYLVGNTLFFADNNSYSSLQRGLHKSDGTTTGTMLLKSFANGCQVGVTMNGVLFFVGYGSADDWELWKSDGTEAGTVMVKNIRANGGGLYGSNSRSWCVSSATNTLYFYANDGIHGTELWKTDGTEAGTVMVKDITPGSESNFATKIMDVNGVLIFATVKSGYYDYYHFWKTDGTEAGTVSMMGDVELFNVEQITVLGNSLFFSAYTETEGTELWHLLNTPKNTQSINLGLLPAKTYGDAPFQLPANTTAGLPITYESSNPQIATVSGNTVTILKAGTTTIRASQIGNMNTAAAKRVARNLLVKQAPQNIVFTPIPTQYFGTNSFSLNVVGGTSGNPIVYSSSNTTVATVSNGGIVSIHNPGQTTITATQAGNDNYLSAVNISQNLVVEKGNQTINFANLPTKTIGDNPFALNAVATSGLTVVYTSSNPSVASVLGNTITIHSLGTTVITASQGGNINFNAAPNITQNLTITKVPQNINFSIIPDKLYGELPFRLNATSNTNYTIFYTSSNPNVVSIVGDLATIVGIGTVSITANQPGDNYYADAQPVTRTFKVDYPTSVSPNLSIEEISVFPNPSNTGFFEIHGLNQMSVQKIGYTLYNPSGKIVQTGSWVSHGVCTLDISHLLNGTYLIEIEVNQQKITKKIIKN